MDHVAGRWWSLQTGVREDLGAGEARGWAAFGVRGLAPQGFTVEATAYARAGLRTAARLRIENEVLFTQRLILQPEIELNFYDRADAARALGAGLSELEAGLRLRYEVRREFAPYVGLVFTRRRGPSTDLARDAALEVNELRVAVGLRLWF